MYCKPLRVDSNSTSYMQIHHSNAYASDDPTGNMLQTWKRWKTFLASLLQTRPVSFPPQAHATSVST